MESARILMEVTAGLIPGTTMPEHTMQFAITSDQWYAQGKYEGKAKEAQLEILQVYGFAQEYMRNLMNPKVVNWVRLDWIYL
jgi:hypothetical protein